MKNFINVYDPGFKFFYSGSFYQYPYQAIGAGQLYDQYGFIKTINSEGEEIFGLIINNPSGGDLIVTNFLKLPQGYLVYARNSDYSEHFVIGLKNNYNNEIGIEEMFLWFYQTQSVTDSKLFISIDDLLFRITESPLDFHSTQPILFADFDYGSTTGYGFQLIFHEDFRYVLKSQLQYYPISFFFLLDDENYLYIAVFDYSRMSINESFPLIKLMYSETWSGFDSLEIEEFMGYWNNASNTMSCFLSGRDLNNNNDFFTASFNIEIPETFFTGHSIWSINITQNIKINYPGTAGIPMSASYPFCENGKIIHSQHFGSKEIDYASSGYQMNGYIKHVDEQTDPWGWLYHHEGDPIFARIDPLVPSDFLFDAPQISSNEETFYINTQNNGPYHVVISVREFHVDGYTHELAVFNPHEYIEKGMEGLIVNLTKHDQSYLKYINPPEPEPTPIKVNITSNTIIQSPYTTLLAAGSTGADGSVEGIHLRWLFNGELGDKHLPKGNSTSQTHNFNKKNDFVRILRTPCNAIERKLNLNNEPQIKDNYQALWIYNLGNGRKIHLHFIDKDIYNRLNDNNDLYLSSYFGEGGRLEITSESELFFKMMLNFNCTGIQLQTEVLSDLRSNSSSKKKTIISSRKKQYYPSATHQVWFNAENGQGIRVKTDNKKVWLNELIFLFYSDIVDKANTNKTWEEIGEFSLSTTKAEAYQRLEPKEGTIHAKWPRFTKGTGVNIQNYKNRWSSGITAIDNLNEWGIQEVVQQYLRESEAANNPIAAIDYPEETYEGEDPEQKVERTPDEEIKISLLQLINFGATDYHIARMLGLGTIDSSAKARDGNKYMYLLEYYSQGDLQNGKGNTETHHLYFSAPTSKYDERLPLPVKIKDIKGGIEFDDSNISEDYGMNLVGNDGYSVDGRFRYVTLIAEDEIDSENGQMDFDGEEFDLNNNTLPVYTGVRYKLKKKDAVQTPSNWLLPELSNDLTSKCAVLSGEPYNETIPLIVSENKRIIYVHKQKDSGTHYYKTYGINIFSRPDSLHNDNNENVKECITNLYPENLLKSPSGIHPFLIREEDESILTFSTRYEQDILKSINNSENDKTLVRLLFNYNANQDSYNYQVSDEYQDFSKWELIDGKEAGTEQGEKIKPYSDDTEVYADKIEIFLRNKLPVQTTGKINKVTPHPTNELLSIIYTEPYTFASTQETVTPQILQDIAPNFRSGVFLLGKEKYIISKIQHAGENPIIEVFNQEISQRMLFEEVNKDLTYRNEKMIIPDKNTNDGLFTAIENMQLISSWRQVSGELFNDQESLKIDISSSFPTIKREVFKKTVDGEPVRFIEKSRGFWKNAHIEKVASDEECNFLLDSEKKIILDENGNPCAYEENGIYTHHGLYRVILHELLPAHSQQDNNQFKDGDKKFNVEFQNGQVRLLITSTSDSDTQVKDGENASEKYYTERKSFNIVLTRKEIHTINNIKSEVSALYFEAPEFILEKNNETKIIKNQEVNYYPNYKVYLKADSISNLKDDFILPSLNDDNEEVRYSIFGLRSYKQKNVHMLSDYNSKISVPAVMFAQKIIPPMQPKKPEAITFSTRPDSFGKSSFSFTTTFEHTPYSVLFYRSSENAMLNALYEPKTIEYIRQRLDILGGTSEDFVRERWEDFVKFNTTIYENSEGIERHTYKQIPPSYETDYEPGTSFTLPLPDISVINKYIKAYNEEYKTKYENLNSGLTSFTDYVIPGKITLIEFIKESIYSTFVPLTEVPVIFKYIKDISNEHRPEPKKQKVRGRNGNLLKADDPEFEMAPMAGKIDGNSNNPKIQFVDFNLDGTNRNLYFYCTREMNAQMQMGEFSDIAGPIKTVDTSAPATPKIISIIPDLEESKIGFEINSYFKEENVRKITIHRAFNSLDARSIRTMTPIKEIYLDDYTIENSSWSFADDFMLEITENGEKNSVQYIPYGDLLFYRITVSRWVQYTNYSTPQDSFENEYVSSKPSKLISTMMIESKSPETPKLRSNYDPENHAQNLCDVVLSWNKTAYKAKYYLYKMNSQGNWTKIYDIKSVDNPFSPVEGDLSVKLLETEIDPTTLVKKVNDTPIYHHFKIVAENTSGMLSNEEIILTI